MKLKDIGVIAESSLSRLYTHNEKHDCAAMTAFRTARDCGDGEKYSKKENKQRNKSLAAKLKSAGYGVTRLQGTYPEGGSTAKEESFFIVDNNDKGNLEANIKRLGSEFEQDSVLFMPKGSINNKTKAYLVGTNRCPNNWLGSGNKEVFNKGKMGYDSPIYTSKVNGRPFIFESVLEEIKDPGNGMGWWALNRAATKPWEEIELND
jgi:hypothetical protein